MKRSEWLELRPYKYPVLLYKGSWKQLAAYCRARDLVDIGSEFQCFMGHVLCLGGDDGPYSIIWLKSWKSSIAEHGALVHECIHACVACLEDREIPLSMKHGGHEALTYLVEDLYKQCAWNLGTFNTGTLDKPKES